MPQSTLTPALLAKQLQALSREVLCKAACNAYALRQTQAAEKIADACQEVLS
jgi:UDP-N-acetylglucosamine:LPS N-acetylglucosamine transferase